MSMIADLFGIDNAPWMHQPKPCDIEPDRWFPPTEQAAERIADQLCTGCSAKNACLAYALEIKDQHAIMGGLSAGQRARLAPQDRHLGPCSVCAAPMYGQPGRGGRRLYCSNACKRAARSAKEAAA